MRPLRYSFLNFLSARYLPSDSSSSVHCQTRQWASDWRTWLDQTSFGSWISAALSLLCPLHTVNVDLKKWKDMSAVFPPPTCHVLALVRQRGLAGHDSLLLRGKVVCSTWPAIRITCQVLTSGVHNLGNCVCTPNLAAIRVIDAENVWRRDYILLGTNCR